MGLAAWLDLKGADVFAFFVAGLLGFGAGLLVPHSYLAIYIPILVSYHLFLAWLLLTADHETGVSLPFLSTIVTHLAFMAVVMTLGAARNYIPFFGVIRFAVAGLALFERSWLFVKTEKKEAPVEAPVITSSAEDYQEWTRHIAQRKSSSVVNGASLKAEYEQWVRARAQSRSAASSRG
jgi:hypothetical protein